MQKTCNGWKNYQTWNVALWIGNDYGIYCAAKEFMNKFKGRAPYSSFISAMGLNKTGDNVSFNSKKLSLRELNSMMREL